MTVTLDLTIEEAMFLRRLTGGELRRLRMSAEGDYTAQARRRAAYELGLATSLHEKAGSW